MRLPRAEIPAQQEPHLDVCRGLPGEVLPVLGPDALHELAPEGSQLVGSRAMPGLGAHMLVPGGCSRVLLVLVQCMLLRSLLALTSNADLAH